MHLLLPELRAACAADPFLARLIQICATTRQHTTTRFIWCQRQLHAPYTREAFKKLHFAFLALERTGFGRIRDGAQMTRARFEWAVMPLSVERALHDPDTPLTPNELLPAAEKMGISLPTPAPLPLGRPGWTRHDVTLRPGEHAELLVPDDLSPLEATWLATYLGRLAARPPAAPPREPLPTADEPAAPPPPP